MVFTISTWKKLQNITSEFLKLILSVLFCFLYRLPPPPPPVKETQIDDRSPQLAVINRQLSSRLRCHSWLGSLCFIQSVRMKGIHNNKKYISETNCHARIRFMSSERKTLEVFFMPGLRACATTFLPQFYESPGHIHGWELDRQRWTNRLAS
jgi:hypothetical protein